MQTLRAATAETHPATAGADLAEVPDGVPEPAKASPSHTTLAFRDVIEGARAFRLWSMLGWQDIRQRYRRSTLGPFWLTISMGVLVAALGLLYAGLFKVNVSDYLPFVAVGFIVWGLISDTSHNLLCTVPHNVILSCSPLLRQFLLNHLHLTPGTICDGLQLSVSNLVLSDYSIVSVFWRMVPANMDTGWSNK